jgi:DNA-binding SARP family transcriptional activator
VSGGRRAAQAVVLRLLGVPWVGLRRGGEMHEVRVRLRRAVRLLAYLALAPDRRAPKDALVEALFPEADADAIRRNFHPTVSILRRALAATGSSVVEARGGIYSLADDVVWEIDSEEFARRAAQGEAALARGEHAAAVAALSGAWQLYRGPLVQGLEEPWIAPHRERLQRRQVVALRSLGDALLRLGRAGEAVDAYRALLIEDPLQEPAHVALMQAYGREGRRDLVRRQYERLARLLREELGVEPEASTTLEYHALMA